ncbi:MAG: hypothetical protein LQ346_009078 [Caloplaca aetnensis]|nr:MAG: hypothetical protein LQ346_009078 [Caloplaca aetnensis]
MHLRNGKVTKPSFPAKSTPVEPAENVSVPILNPNERRTVKPSRTPLRLKIQKPSSKPTHKMLIIRSANFEYRFHDLTSKRRRKPTFAVRKQQRLDNDKELARFYSERRGLYIDPLRQMTWPPTSCFIKYPESTIWLMQMHKVAEKLQRLNAEQANMYRQVVEAAGDPGKTGSIAELWDAVERFGGRVAFDGF